MKAPHAEFACKSDPYYLEDQSDPDEPRYVWAHTVRIDNESEEVVQLRTRHWRITDALGFTDVVNGDGVVGEQPVLRPGEGFEYTSGATTGHAVRVNGRALWHVDYWRGGL